LGVNLTPIIVKRVTSLEALSGKSMAVDAFNVLHQFLALIRTRDGTPLSDPQGRITSHLVGLVFRTTRLIADHRMGLIFVFDGKPPRLKRGEVDRRRALRRRAEEAYAEAIEAGDLAKAHSKAVQTGRLTREMVEDSQRLLDLLGTPRLVRYLTIQGQEWLPSKGRARRLEPEVIDLEAFLGHHGITREQLVDLGILMGTDFNDGIKGVGPKTALKLVREHGRLEDMPEKVASRLPSEYPEIRRLFLEPEVTDDYTVAPGKLDGEGLIGFLCGERGFSRERVESVVERIERSKRQKSLSDWMVGRP